MTSALALLFAFSCRETDFRDFGFLIGKTASNKEEVGKIIANYLNASDREEKEAYAYILNHIEEQYHIRFRLEKEGKTVPLDGRVGTDSIISLQNEGFVLNSRDTVRDLDVLSAEDLQKHVQQFAKNWKSPPPGTTMPFQAYLKHTLPYRTNNEHPETVFKINDRYPVPDLIRKNAARDTIERIKNKVSTIAGQYSGRLNGVNFLNTTDHNDLLLRKEGSLFSDYEDRFVFEMGMLRRTGVPAVGLFCPHRRHGANRPYSVQAVTDERWIDSLEPGSIAKLYVSSFEASEWDNPFDRLLALGVERERIPLSLYIPKMRDITERATETGDISCPISERTVRSMAVPVAYLCTYSLGQWIPIDFSLIGDNKARFSKIGTNVLYMVCTYAEGRLAPVSFPVTLDGMKGHREIAGDDPAMTEEVVFAQEAHNRPLRKNKAYRLYFWDKETGWAHLKDFTTGEGQIYKTDVPKDRLYLVKTKESSFFAPRPFTMSGNKQVWW